MRTDIPIAVCSRSFSENEILRKELNAIYTDVRYNQSGHRLKDDELIDFLSGRHKAIVALERIDAQVLSQLPELKVVSKYGVGLDGIDQAALQQFGVTLGWSGGVNRRAVAELVIAQTINLLRGISDANLAMRQGQWTAFRGRQLSSITFGILGCGHIGKEVARLLQAFGTRILAHDLELFPEFYANHGITAVSLETLLKTADVVSVHLPLDDSTRGLLGVEQLGAMGPQSYLINTARGGIVDEVALADSLERGTLGGAAFDVFEREPLKDSRLLSAPNFVCTPHMAGTSQESVLAMGRAAISGLGNG